MKRHSWRLAALFFGFSFFVGNFAAAFAAEKAPLYQGKTLNIIINFAAGSPTEIESRIFAKQLTEVCAAGERLFKQASQVSPKLSISYARTSTRGIDSFSK